MLPSVRVLNPMNQPLAPIHPAHARRLLKMGKAIIICRQPFTILLKPRSNAREEVSEQGTTSVSNVLHD